MRFIFFLALCHGVGRLNTFYSDDSLREWYGRLKKPSWNPPNWVFGRVWLLLYTLMAWAASRVSHDPQALLLFVAQLALNATWTYCFFARRSPGLAMGVNLLLAATVWFCISHFATLDLLAAALFIPYQAWMSFAILHNYSIWRLNR